MHKVIVTAGASGIGAAIAERFLKDGSQVHIADVNAEAMAGLESRPELTSSVTDVSDEKSVSEMFDQALDAMGGLNVMVNCAGIAGPTAAIEDVTLDDWRTCLAVNLDATFLCSREAVPYLKKSDNASIINMSSTAGLMGYPMRTPYVSAKWALIGLTKTLAMELGPDTTSGPTSSVPAASTAPVWTVSSNAKPNRKASAKTPSAKATPTAHR